MATGGWNSSLEENFVSSGFGIALSEHTPFGDRKDNCHSCISFPALSCGRDTLGARGHSLSLSGSPREVLCHVPQRLGTVWDGEVGTHHFFSHSYHTCMRYVASGGIS